jgi:hypothetical protein
VQIDGEPRLLILSTQGQPVDLRLPSADRQKKEKPTRISRVYAKRGRCSVFITT